MSECKDCVVYIPFGNINKVVIVHPVSEYDISVTSKYENAYLLCETSKKQMKIWKERYVDKHKLTRDMLYSTNNEYVLDELRELSNAKIEKLDFENNKKVKAFLIKMAKLVNAKRHRDD